MKKFIFYCSVIGISVISTLVVISLCYSLSLLIEGSEKAQGILTKATMYLFFLRLTGTLAFIFIGIATALGATRNIIFSFYKNTNFWKIHTQWASSIGIGLATAHFTIYLLYELRLGVPLTLTLFYPNFARFTTSTSNLIFLSTTALLVFGLNFIISNIPSLKASRLWKPLHIFNYLGFFLVVIHAYYLGSNSGELLFQILYSIFLILALLGAFHRFFKFSSSTKPPKKVLPPTTISTDVVKPAIVSSAKPAQQPTEPLLKNNIPLHDEEIHVVNSNT